jgi:hypothetical protein
MKSHTVEKEFGKPSIIADNINKSLSFSVSDILRMKDTYLFGFLLFLLLTFSSYSIIPVLNSLLWLIGRFPLFELQTYLLSIVLNIYNQPILTIVTYTCQVVVGIFFVAIMNKRRIYEKQVIVSLYLGSLTYGICATLGVVFERLSMDGMFSMDPIYGGYAVFALLQYLLPITIVATAVKFFHSSFTLRI